ncbi:MULTISPECIES: SAV_6107 family HEPN domain-containing protein [unclassified Embleya]|uniref:SAV_6107 family HEPN domain-containing protein n=1 Tax=unclassified Embleya TaxID=2699296 RepID=UPI0036BF88A1
MSASASPSASWNQSAHIPEPPPIRRAPVRWSSAPRGALDLLTQARRGLTEAAVDRDAAERYATAHLAALRVAAAVLAARAQADDERAGRRRRAPRSAWELLPKVAPELTEWAAFFAAGARKRAAAEAGLPGAVTGREADDLIRDVETFFRLVVRLLALPPIPAPPPPID